MKLSTCNVIQIFLISRFLSHIHVVLECSDDEHHVEHPPTSIELPYEKIMHGRTRPDPAGHGFTLKMHLYIGYPYANLV